MIWLLFIALAGAWFVLAGAWAALLGGNADDDQEGQW
jgi:hypothetical protein